MNINKLIENLEKDIKKTKDSLQQSSQLVRLKEIAEKYNGEDEMIESRLFAEYLKNRPEEFNIKSGWTQFDKILGGFRLGQVVTVSGFTKHGKTSWNMDLTSKLEEYNPAWFPLEEGAEELITKFQDRGIEVPLFYFPKKTKTNNLEWIEEKIIESIAKYNTKVVFIDQLDFLVPYKANGENHLLIGHTMRELKRIATTWGVVIFLMAHLKQATSLTIQPTLSDLKGSASIAQESDTVIFIWRENYKEKGEIVITDNTNISIQANRRTGKTGSIKMVCVNYKFLEQEWERKDDPELNEENIGKELWKS